MLKLLIISLLVTTLAFASQQRMEYCSYQNSRYRVRDDYAYICLLILLILFTGLRREYNDTWNYIDGFNRAPGLREFLRNPDSYNIFKNPLFYFFQSTLKSITDNGYFLIFLSSAFTQICFLRFFKNHSTHFGFTVFLYFTYGTFCFSMAAIKQILAMAVLTLAIPYLEKGKIVKYYLMVFVAMLLHTYALMFVVLPLFTGRPWKTFTFVFVLVMAFVLTNFREVIEEFMNQANEVGKNLADYEVLDDNTVNILRFLVYAIVPLMSLFFQNWLFYRSTSKEHILINMSILSLAFMTMGTQAGANMFARMATYFELGTICALPWMLEQIFDKKSYRMVSALACVLFSLYFVYSFGINIRFDDMYKAIPIWRLFIG